MCSCARHHWKGQCQCYHCVCRTSMCCCTMHCWMVCFSAITVFAGPVCVPVPCTVGWSVSVLSLCLQDQYVLLYHALLDGLFQCYHCVYRTSMCCCTMHCWMICFSAITVFTGPVCVPVPCTVGWSVSVLSLCLQDQYVLLYHELLDGLFQCWHCVCRTTSMCSCSMHC